MKALILAGGFGKSLRSITGDEIPLSMALIAGKPFLEHQIRFLRENGIKEIIIAVHYHADKIKAYFGNGLRLGVNISYSDEEYPLGTAGAIKNAQRYINDTFLVLNGNSYSQIDLNAFIKFHNENKSDFSISLTNVKDSDDYGRVVVEGNKVVDFSDQVKDLDGKINSGVYIFEPKIFDYIDARKKISLEKEVFPILAKKGLFYGFFHDGYFVDLKKPETYNKFKKDVLDTITLRSGSRLIDAMKKISKTDIDLVLIVNEQKELLGVLTNNIIREYLLNGGNINDSVEDSMVRDPVTAKVSDDRDKISELLFGGINKLPIIDDEGRLVDVEFRIENIKQESFPTLRGRAPLRISFAGGGTDLPSFFDKFGGVVINATIDKYCYATLIKRADRRIIIDSDISSQEEIIVDSIEGLRYDGHLDLVKAIIKVMNPDFGFELYLHNDLPPGRGLGSSASFSVLLISLLCHLQGVSYDDYKIAEIAYRAECEELNIRGGWQDQYAAVTGGFNFIEFNCNKKIIYPLKLKEDVVNEFNEHLILCYVGQEHYSFHQQSCLQRSIMSNEDEKIKNLNDLKKIAVEIKDLLLTNNVIQIGKLLNDSWERKKQMSDKISNPKIDFLYSVGLANGAYGGKLLGSGGGGYILFFCCPKKRKQLKFALKDAGGEVMNFRFEFSGTKIWPVKRGI
jgi:D-glycero-alpha-D-manno-heptose-7-phosphate kinase